MIATGHQRSAYNHLYPMYPMPCKSPEASHLERELGISFRNQELLRLALVHSSYVNEAPGESEDSNERLEFLGDALLGLVVAEELYQRHPGLPEGRLTAHRAAIVRGETLARIADGLRLGDHLVLGRGEEGNAGRQRPSNLAGALEALVGAIFLDQGYEAAREFVLSVLSEELSTVGGNSDPGNAKSSLQELVQGMGLTTPTYRIVEATGQDHEREFVAEVLVNGEVAGRGIGRRKASAEQEAAKAALEALGQGM